MHGPVWGVRTREEVAEELEDYKKHLELEIRELERKIKSLKEKAAE
jgi:chaperonin cofactor prefoldin